MKIVNLEMYVLIWFSSLKSVTKVCKINLMVVSSIVLLFYGPYGLTSATTVWRVYFILRQSNPFVVEETYMYSLHVQSMNKVYSEGWNIDASNVQAMGILLTAVINFIDLFFIF